MAVNVSIPALYQGVSQQPAALRAMEQVELLVNGYLTVADGNRKRPPTQYVALMRALTPTEVKVHQYFRGDGEHNILMFYNSGGLGQVWANDGTTGAAKTVDWTDAPSAAAYLECANPVEDLGCLTVADTTYVWNRTVPVAMKASTIAAQTPKLFVYIKEGYPDSDYTIDLPGFGTAVFNTGGTASNRSTMYIATQLKALIDAFAGTPFTVTLINNLLTIERVDGSDFPFVVYDSSGSTLMYAFKNRVERYSDLPRYFEEGVTVEVRGQGDSGGDGAFWVHYVSDTHTQAGHWEETVAPIPGEPTEFDEETLPVMIVRQADGSFKVQRPVWDARLVGSTASDTVPIPSFVGGVITSLFFYRGRLGFLSGENVVLSRANNLYAFWPKSAVTVSDDDPIDVTANGARVALLKHAVPFQRMLMLFSDNTQFPMTGGEVLSARTARIDPATEFDCSPLVSPVSSGQDLFFVFPRSSGYSGVREYFVNQTASTNDATDVTAHVSQYVPGGVFRASVSSTEDLLLLVSREEYNAVYFYKYLWDGEKKVQSAWGKWTFRPSDKVLAADIDQDTVHLVIQRVDGVHLERMELGSAVTTGSLPFQIHLDSLAQDDRSGLPPAYDANLDETALWKPYDLPEGEGTLQVVAGPDFERGAGTVLPIVGVQGVAGVRVKGDWRAHPCYFGVQYAHRTTFSEQFMRDRNGTAMTQGRLQLKHLTVNFRDAAVFRLEVDTPGRDTAVYRYASLRAGIIGSLIGAAVLRSGSHTFPIASKSDRATITLVNDSPYPATFHSAEWEGQFTSRSPRR